MTAYRRVYGFRHLRVDCRRRGSAPEPYARLEYRRGLPLSKTTHTTGHTVSAMLFLRAIGSRQRSSLSKAGHGGPGVICTTISINMCVTSALTPSGTYEARGSGSRLPQSWEALCTATARLIHSLIHATRLICDDRFTYAKVAKRTATAGSGRFTPPHRPAATIVVRSCCSIRRNFLLSSHYTRLSDSSSHGRDVPSIASKQGDTQRQARDDLATAIACRRLRRVGRDVATPAASLPNDAATTYNCVSRLPRLDRRSTPIGPQFDRAIRLFDDIPCDRRHCGLNM